MIAATLLAAALTLGPVLRATTWANVAAPPPTQNRVTIVDVFAFSCINCKHVTPELRKLRAAYDPKDLTIVGVHAPELPFEKVHANLLDAIRIQRLDWPVLFDDDFRVWEAYGVNAWPTQLIFDRRGVLRATFVGEGYDDQIDRLVAKLAAERA